MSLATRMSCNAACTSPSSINPARAVLMTMVFGRSCSNRAASSSGWPSRCVDRRESGKVPECISKWDCISEQFVCDKWESPDGSINRSCVANQCAKDEDCRWPFFCKQRPESQATFRSGVARDAGIDDSPVSRLRQPRWIAFISIGADAAGDAVAEGEHRGAGR